MNVHLAQDPRQCTWNSVLREEEAIAKWNHWEQTHEQDDEIFSVTMGGVLHIRVGVRLMMNYVTSTGRENKAEITAVAKKKASQDDLDNATSKLALNMDKFGGADVDLTAHAGAILKSGANPLHALSDIAATLPNVKALLDEDSQQEDDDEAEEESVEGEEGDEGKPKKGKGQKEKKKPKKDGEWWPREDFCVRNETALNTLVDKDATNLQNCFSTLEKDYKALICTYIYI